MDFVSFGSDSSTCFGFDSGLLPRPPVCVLWTDDHEGEDRTLGGRNGLSGQDQDEQVSVAIFISK